MLEINIIAVGKLKDRFFEDASAEYLKRLKAFADVTVSEVKQQVLPSEPTEGEISNALAKEAQDIAAKIPAGALVVPLCIEGKELTSEGFADFFASSAVSGVSSVAFIIGGSCGLDERIKKMGKLRLSMSPMTFPHRLARIMLLEQIYRAFSINAGRKYHK